MKVEVFDDHVGNMQERVQKWMERNPNFKICHVAQSQGLNVNFVLLTIFYTCDEKTAASLDWIEEAKQKVEAIPPAVITPPNLGDYVLFLIDDVVSAGMIAQMSLPEAKYDIEHLGPSYETLRRTSSRVPLKDIKAIYRPTRDNG